MCGSDRDTWKHKPVKKEDSKRKVVINNKMGGGETLNHLLDDV